MTHSHATRLTRRTFLRTTMAGFGAMGLGTVVGRAAPPVVKSDRPDSREYDFVFSRLKFRDLKRKQTQWAGGANGDQYLLDNLRKHVSIHVQVARPKGSELTRVADLADLKQVLEFPFLFMTDNLGFELPEVELRNLRTYLEAGGFLYADDCVEGATGDFFFQAFRKQMAKAFPGKKMEKLPDDHPVNRCCFSFPFTPFFQGRDHGTHGLYLDGRLAVLLTSGDIHCGWCQPGENWFGPGSFKRSIQMGINIVVFALTQQGRLKPTST